MRPSSCAAAVALALLVLPAVASASPGQVTYFQAPRELLGADAGLRARTFAELQALGVRALRITLYWKDVAPAPTSGQVPAFNERDPAAYPGFAAYDAAIVGARARGMRVLLTVSGPVPRWATRDRKDDRTRPVASRYQRFMTAVGTRYRALVDDWAIWNEPNHPRFLLPQFTKAGPASPRIYRTLVQAGLRGLAASGNGSDRVLAGETAPRGTGKVVAPLAFLRGTLCLNAHYHRHTACGRLDVDGWATHPYTTRSGPFFVPPRRDDVTIGVLGRMNSALAKAGKAGALRKGIGMYLTEFGIQSKPDPFVGVSFTAQAEYRSIAERLAYANPRVRAFSQYLMRDDQARDVGASAANRFGGFESGLRTAGGRIKRSYEGFRLPLVACLGRTRTRLWGLVRPATGATRVAIEYASAGSSHWRALKDDATDARGYWSTTTRQVAGRRYRVRWTDPRGGAHTGPPTRSYRSGPR